MKKIFTITMLVLIIFLAGQVIHANNVNAQDYWVYSSPNGTSYWVDGNTATVHRNYYHFYQGVLKTIRNGQCIDRTEWEFSADEGYVFADVVGTDYGFAIWKNPQIHDGDTVIENRPELLAMLKWFDNNKSWLPQTNPS